MEIKFDCVVLATVFAISVLPVPGGPCNNTPFGVFTPKCCTSLACFSGHSMASSSSFFRVSSPPTSSHLVSGICTNISLMAEGCASLTASFMSCFVILISFSFSGDIFWLLRSISGNIRRSDLIAASFINDCRSAPTNPWVIDAIFVRSRSSPNGTFLVCISNICILPSLSGTPISISRSNLPGLRRAGSIESILFVAAITTTLPRFFIPSINVSI